MSPRPQPLFHTSEAPATEKPAAPTIDPKPSSRALTRVTAAETETTPEAPELPEEGVGDMSMDQASQAALQAVSAKISAIMAEAPALSKSGHNDFHNYDYVPIEAYYQALRPLMAKHRLVYYHEHAGEPKVRAINNKGLLHYVWPFSLYLVDADTGHRLAFRLTAHARDNEDKGPGKAISLCSKYFLGATFMLAAEDGEKARPDQMAERNGRSQKKGGQPERARKKQRPAHKKPEKMPQKASTDSEDVAARYQRIIDGLYNGLLETPVGINDRLRKAYDHIARWPDPWFPAGKAKIDEAQGIITERQMQLGTLVEAIRKGMHPGEAAEEFAPSMGDWPEAWKAEAEERFQAAIKEVEAA